MPLATVQEGEAAGNGRHQKLVRSATVNTTVKNTNSSSQQQSLGELIICAICLEQLKRPTMVYWCHINKLNYKYQFSLLFDENRFLRYGMMT